MHSGTAHRPMSLSIGAPNESDRSFTLSFGFYTRDCGQSIISKYIPHNQNVPSAINEQVAKQATLRHDNQLSVWKRPHTLEWRNNIEHGIRTQPYLNCSCILEGIHYGCFWMDVRCTARADQYSYTITRRYHHVIAIDRSASIS